LGQPGIPDAGEPPYPTSSDLYAELRAVTPDSLKALLVDLFETITLWNVKTERAVVEPTGTGEYRVTIDVVAKKMRADSVGQETEVPMDDFVEIGVFAPGGDKGLGEPLYLKRHPIRSRQAGDQHHGSAGANPRRHRSLSQADRPAGQRQRRRGESGRGRSRRSRSMSTLTRRKGGLDILA
jgi:hypothetical protein